MRAPWSADRPKSSHNVFQIFKVSGLHDQKSLMPVFFPAASLGPLTLPIGSEIVSKLIQTGPILYCDCYLISLELETATVIGYGDY